VYLQGVAPTGRYDPTFAPNIGLHRPGIDTGWAFTWTDKVHKFQVNGAVGVTFNFENDETDYKSGDELHFEWAIGREFAPGLILGIRLSLATRPGSSTRDITKSTRLSVASRAA
jgi:hypothetical protein